MGDAKTHVELAEIGVECDFDVKKKQALSTAATAAVEAVINKSKYLTTGKGADGFYVDGGISVKSTEKGKSVVLEGSAQFQIATWPKKSMFGFPTGTAQVPATPDDLEGYAEDLAKALGKSIAEKQIVPTLVKRLGK